MEQLEGGILPSFKVKILGNPSFGINQNILSSVSGTLISKIDSATVTGSRIQQNGTFSLKTTILSSGKAIPNNTFLKIVKNNNDIDANNPSIKQLSLGIYLEVLESGQNYGHENDLVDVVFNGITTLNGGQVPKFKVKVLGNPYGISKIIPTPENVGTMLTNVDGAQVNSKRTVGGSFSLKVSIVSSG